MDNFIEQVIISAVINFIISGLVLTLTVWYINKTLNNKENREKENTAIRKKKIQLGERWKHSVGKLLFWLVEAAIDNKDTVKEHIEEAFCKLNEVEEEIKEYDYKILAEKQDENR